MAAGLDDATLDRLLTDNAAAVEELIASARVITESRWSEPLAPNKWSVREHLDHVRLAYDAAVDDAAHGRPMRYLGTPLKRQLWRLIGLTSVTRLRRLPSGAKAPREIRPAAARSVDPQIVEALRRHLRAFDLAMRSTASSAPNHSFAHPYFGTLTLEQTVTLLAVHTRHHARAIRRASR